jgi:hypothetical protein
MAKKAPSASGLTPAETRAMDEELAEARIKTRRKILILLGLVAIPLYLWAAMVISAHNK